MLEIANAARTVEDAALKGGATKPNRNGTATNLPKPRPCRKTMHTFTEPYWWAVVLTSIVQLVLFVRWLYRRIRNDELTRAFVEDMATNHLPHIYELLERLCDRQGIARAGRPSIRWVDLNGRTH
ncbi:MAG: hypothetical protein ACRD4S_00935 [Candidatus Acidiferrales bacterium]